MAGMEDELKRTGKASLAVGATARLGRTSGLSSGTSLVACLSNEVLYAMLMFLLLFYQAQGSVIDFSSRDLNLHAINYPYHLLPLPRCVNKETANHHQSLHYHVDSIQSTLYRAR